MNTSLGYSRQHNGELLPSETLVPAMAQVIGIIEIIKMKEYEKGNGFYVISRDNHVRLRYLMVVQGQSSCSLDRCEKHYYSYLKEERQRLEARSQAESEPFLKQFEKCLERERARQDGLR